MPHLGLIILSTFCIHRSPCPLERLLWLRSMANFIFDYTCKYLEGSLILCRLSWTILSQSSWLPPNLAFSIGSGLGFQLCQTSALAPEPQHLEFLPLPIIHFAWLLLTVMELHLVKRSSEPVGDGMSRACYHGIWNGHVLLGILKDLLFIPSFFNQYVLPIFYSLKKCSLFLL